MPWAGFSVAGLALVLADALGSSALRGQGGSVTDGGGKVIGEA